MGLYENGEKEGGMGGSERTNGLGRGGDGGHAGHVSRQDLYQHH